MRASELFQTCQETAVSEETELALPFKIIVSPFQSVTMSIKSAPISVEEEGRLLLLREPS